MPGENPPADRPAGPAAGRGADPLGPDFRMHAERTPNPNSIKWVLGTPLVEDGRSAFFDAPPSSQDSPLASRLFAVRGVEGVFVAPGFVTVTKSDDVEWTDIAQAVVDAIKTHVASGTPALAAGVGLAAAEGGSDVEQRIRRVIDEEIRPAVAMDGGDVVFAGFREGRVELYMQGSCSGCPSSRATLKLGIEARLREEVPEVQEVVAL